MTTTNPPNINHRRIVDFSPKFGHVNLLNIRPPEQDMFVSETRYSPLWTADIVFNKSLTLESHNELAEVLLEVSAFW